MTSAQHANQRARPARLYSRPAVEIPTETSMPFRLHRAAACLVAAAGQSGDPQCAALPANYVPAERSVRQNPWFVDITPKDSGTSRFYFSLTSQ